MARKQNKKDIKEYNIVKESINVTLNHAKNNILHNQLFTIID